jgi:CRISPR-associated Csx3 family protein
MITLDLETLYQDTGTAKLADLPAYEQVALQEAGSGNVVKLTGRAPVWLYLRIAHVLHGKVKTLIYDSPVTGEVVIFDHDPY